MYSESTMYVCGALESILNKVLVLELNPQIRTIRF